MNCVIFITEPSDLSMAPGMWYTLNKYLLNEKLTPEVAIKILI